MALVGIDPSLRFLGWARAKVEWSKGKRKMCLTGSGLLIGDKKLEWVERACSIVQQLLEKNIVRNEDTVVLELPQRFFGRRGQRGLLAESVQKLYFLVGYMGGVFEFIGCNVVFTRPSEWKGQVSKEITKERVVRRIGGIPSSVRQMSVRQASNIYDAIGLIIWYMEKKGV
jgi:hypothetical protein